MKTGTATLGERATGIGLNVLTGAVLIFLVAPILTIVPLSFSSGSFFYYPLPGLSLRWYEDFFTSAFWLSSLKNSLIIGVSATVLATVLGTLAALGIWRARFPAQALVLAMLISPMVVPVVIVAVGAYFAFAPLGLTDGYLGLILAHATLGVPFVVITVLATLSGFDRTLVRAAESLGASQITTFRRVTLPLDFRSFAHWDTTVQDWRVTPGCYGVLVGRSSRDLPLRATVSVGGASCPGAAASIPLVTNLTRARAKATTAPGQ